MSPSVLSRDGTIVVGIFVRVASDSLVGAIRLVIAEQWQGAHIHEYL
jgi:hypothetical protein